jgi:hypothetical protein
MTGNVHAARHAAISARRPYHIEIERDVRQDNFDTNLPIMQTLREAGVFWI